MQVSADETARKREAELTAPPIVTSLYLQS